MAGGRLYHPETASKGRPTSLYQQSRSNGFYGGFYGLVEYDGPTEKLVRDPNDPVAGPIPIREPIGYVTHNATGTRVPYYEPIAGFEHLINREELSQHSGFIPSSQLQHAPAHDKPHEISSGIRLGPLHEHPQQAAPRSPRSCSPSVQRSHTPQTKTRKVVAARRKDRSAKKRAPKRSRSAARLDDTGHDEDEAAPSMVTIATKSFYIGDESAVRHYFTTRLGELTLKPLRKIVTEWVALAEPERRHNYGRYARNSDKETTLGNRPPWWPQQMIYREPSHLKGRAMVPLGVELLMLHRQRDVDGKPRINWVAKLKKSADHYTDIAPDKHFSSGKNLEYNRCMKERAMKDILPNLFEVAKAYEDHVAAYDLFEGMTNDNPEARRGKHITWSLVPRIPRTTSSAKSVKRSRPARSPSSNSEPANEISDIDTEGDTEAEEYESSTLPNGPYGTGRPAQTHTIQQREQTDVFGRVVNGAATPQVVSQQPSPLSAGPRVFPSQSCFPDPLSYPTPPTSFVHSMDGLRIGSFAESESSIGGSFEAQETNGLPHGLFAYSPMPARWTTPNGYHPLFGPCLSQQYEFAGPGSHGTGPQGIEHYLNVGHQDLSYGVPNVDIIPPPSALGFPESSTDAKLSNQHTHTQFESTPADVLPPPADGPQRTFRFHPRRSQQGLPH